MKFTVSEILFRSEGTSCLGRIYLPLDHSQQFPCIVMANGFSGTMDWILPDFAEGFANNGLAVLIFDYRHLGKSGGEPRQIIDPDKQLIDLKNAITFARKHPRVNGNKIVLWGTSLGGNYVLKVAAHDHDIAAVIGNMPAIDAVKGGNIKGKMKKANVTVAGLISASLRMLFVAGIDQLKGLLSLKPKYINVYGKPGRAIFTDPELAARFKAVGKNSPTWKNKVAPRFIFKAPRYEPGTFKKINCPILLALATDDVEISVPFIRKKAKESSRVEIIEYPFGHFDLYHGEIFDTVLGDQISFIRKCIS